MPPPRPPFESEAPKHASVVEAFFAARPAASPLALLEAGLAAVWRRAERTMGPITLAAIADRVVHDAQKQFAFVGDAAVGETGIGLERLRAREAALPGDELARAARYLLIRFLSVLGNLTSDVLTPALHLELANLQRTPEGDP